MSTEPTTVITAGTEPTTELTAPPTRLTNFDQDEEKTLTTKTPTTTAIAATDTEPAVIIPPSSYPCAYTNTSPAQLQLRL